MRDPAGLVRAQLGADQTDWVRHGGRGANGVPDAEPKGG
jgi:hypothetical protein